MFHFPPIPESQRRRQRHYGNIQARTNEGILFFSFVVPFSVIRSLRPTYLPFFLCVTFISLAARDPWLFMSVILTVSWLRSFVCSRHLPPSMIAQGRRERERERERKEFLRLVPRKTILFRIGFFFVLCCTVSCEYIICAAAAVIAMERSLIYHYCSCVSV